VVDLQSALDQLPAVVLDPTPEQTPESNAQAALRTGTVSRDNGPVGLKDEGRWPPGEVPSEVPSGADMGTVEMSAHVYQLAANCNETAKTGVKNEQRPVVLSGPRGVVYCNDAQAIASHCSKWRARDSRNRFFEVVAPTRFALLSQLCAVI